MRNKKSGFTLVEVAIAVVIFAVLGLSLKFIDDCQRVARSSQRTLIVQTQSTKILEQIKEDMLFARVYVSGSYDGLDLKLSKAMLDGDGKVAFGANSNVGWRIQYSLDDTKGYDLNEQKDNIDYNENGTLDDVNFKSCALVRKILNASDTVIRSDSLTPYSIIPYTKTKQADKTYFRRVTIDPGTGIENDDAEGNAIRVSLWFIPKEKQGKIINITRIFNMMLRNE